MQGIRPWTVERCGGREYTALVDELRVVASMSDDETAALAYRLCRLMVIEFPLSKRGRVAML
jgi:hypothetical protein